jgi:ATP-dependent DNA helicase RecQ
LLELRYFVQQLHLTNDIYTIGDEAWEQAKRDLKQHFHHSSKLDWCLNLIKDFEAVYPKRKYKSDLEVFIRESKFEDFVLAQGETIFVSTIHKAKGKEFDHVFMMLDNYMASTDEAKRQLYVGMTRAKRSLCIHINTTMLDAFSAEDLLKFADNAVYETPQMLVMQLSFKDVWLDYFEGRQFLINKLISGQKLSLEGEEGLAHQGKTVLKFSKSFKEKIATHKEKGYVLQSAKVNLLVYWHKEGSTQEVLVVLPEVYLEKQSTKA